jgi:chromosome segregation ATPase
MIEWNERTIKNALKDHMELDSDWLEHLEKAHSPEELFMDINQQHKERIYELEEKISWLSNEVFDLKETIRKINAKKDSLNKILEESRCGLDPAIYSDRQTLIDHLKLLG